MGRAGLLDQDWSVSPGQAREIQRQLLERLVVQPLLAPPATVAGIDVSVKRGTARAAVVVVRYADLVPLEAAVAELPVTFPYVPGLLAFREGPAVLAALSKLSIEPEVLLFDAHGIAHPRRMGLATHLGILLGLPAVGCAKSRLIGAHTEPALERGAQAPLVDKGEVIGAVVRTRNAVHPVFVSVGHRVDLAWAVSLVLACCTRYRLPEPARWAHRVAGGGRLPRPQ